MLKGQYMSYTCEIGQCTCRAIRQITSHASLTVYIYIQVDCTPFSDIQLLTVTLIVLRI